VSVEFEPVRLDRQGRRLDPVALMAVLVVISVAIAVLKPWGGGPDVATVAGDDATPAPAESTDLTGPHATASIALPRVIRATARSTLSWVDVGPVVHRHETWGIRAIVPVLLNDSPLNARQRWVERWYPLALDGASGEPIHVDSNDRSISAIGLTFPPAHTPLDIRFWRETNDGLEWVDTEALDPVPSGGAFLYVRPGIVSGLQRTWEPGPYRVDVLVDGSVRRFGIIIPDRSPNAPATANRPSLRETGPLTAPTESSLADLPVGVFATVDRTAFPLSADEGRPLDETGAWLDLDPGTGRRPRSFVATAYLPRATGLGVALRARSVVVSATLERLAPEPLAVTVERVDPGADATTATSLALFRAPNGSAWTPGVYRISIRWGDVEGLHDDAWHVELRPGPVRELPPLLAAARGWARFAGSTGVVLGTTEPLEGDAASGAVRLVVLRPETTEYPVTTGVGCGGTMIDTNPGILGFAYPDGQYATSVRARILRPFLRRDDQVLMTAAFGVRGLILAAPARIRALPAATYEFTVGRGGQALTYDLCLGMASFDDR
jgi:hypothetical protein